jgi:hypothetical protein
MRVSDAAQDFEDRIANLLCPWLQAHDVLLDLQSFHTPGKPFTMIGPPDKPTELEPFARASEEAMALRLAVGRFAIEFPEMSLVAVYMATAHSVHQLACSRQLLCREIGPTGQHLARALVVDLVTPARPVQI